MALKRRPRSRQNGCPRSLKCAPDDNAFWRIDWFGEVTYPDRYERRTHPSVTVYLSKVTEQDFQTFPEVLLHPSSTAPAKAQKQISVSIGTLMILRIGDIWHRKTLFMSPDYTKETFKNLCVGRATTDFIKAGLNPDKSGFLIPIPEHPWHMNATQV